MNKIQQINGRLHISNDQLSTLYGLNSLFSVEGLVNISVSNIINLEGLESLQYIGSHLIISDNTNLENVEHLNNLTFVGGRLSIQDNPNLISLNGLQNLNNVGEWISILGNSQLTSLSGIDNISPSSFGGLEGGLYITNSENLTTCNLPNICEYLSFDPTQNHRVISGNTGNCKDEQAVLSACGLGVNDVENEMANWQVHYKKENNTFLVQSKGFEIVDIQVYNLNGQLLKEFNGLNSNQEEISVFSPDNILIIKVISTDGKSFAKKVMVK